MEKEEKKAQQAGLIAGAGKREGVGLTRQTPSSGQYDTMQLINSYNSHPVWLLGYYASGSRAGKAERMSTQ